MELRRRIRPSILVETLAILALQPLKKHTSGSRKTGIVCEVPRSNRKHRRTQLVLVVSCNLFLFACPDGFITSTRFYNERNVFLIFMAVFMEPSTFLLKKKSSKHGFSGGFRYRESISLGFTRLSKAEVPAGKDLAAHRSTVIELHPFIWEMVG